MAESGESGEQRGEESERVLRSEEEFFSDWHNVKNFIADVVSERWEAAWIGQWELISASLLVFQEQPTLLSPHLEDIVVPLTNSLIEILQHGDDSKRFQVRLLPSSSSSSSSLTLAEDGQLPVPRHLQGAPALLSHQRIQTRRQVFPSRGLAHRALHVRPPSPGLASSSHPPSTRLLTDRCCHRTRRTIRTGRRAM
jgi:hypothetical protein